MQQLSKLKPRLKRVWRQRRILLYACISVSLIRLALWLFSFKDVRQGLTTVAQRWVAPNQSVSVAAIIWSVTVASVYTPRGAKCLVKALATQLLLNRYGYSHQLHIGVAMGTANALEAHAWIEYQGHVIMGALQDLHRFQPFSTNTGNTGVIL
ncbi:MAG: lasso peptide biosynthesis B2 protein [Cyanobacteria bacterium P01_D01_bin.56]